MIRRIITTFIILTVAIPSIPVTTQAAIPSTYKVKFTIRGKGHGVGMSMAGVYGMAKKGGKGYKEIVDYYYPNTTWTNTDDNEKFQVKCQKHGTWVTYSVKEYLYRLAEEPDDWPKEGLRTLMVAARTYFRYKINKNNGKMPGGQYFVHDIDPSKRPNIVAAVNDTAGQIKTYNGSPIIAAYSSSAGGYTAAFQDTWPGGSTYPYLIRISSPYDKYIPSTWLYTKNVSIGRIQQVFPDVGKINNIKVTKRNRRGSWGGRVLNVRIYGTKKNRDIHGWTFASSLGIDSTIFTFSLRPSLILRASRYTIKRGRAITIYGYLFPKHNGKKVRTYIYKGKKRYYRDAVLYGDASDKSKFKFKFRPRARGKYKFRSRFGGDTDHLSSTSSDMIINVK